MKTQWFSKPNYLIALLLRQEEAFAAFIDLLDIHAIAVVLVRDSEAHFNHGDCIQSHNIELHNLAGIEKLAVKKYVLRLVPGFHGYSNEFDHNICTLALSHGSALTCKGTFGEGSGLAKDMLFLRKLY